MRNSKLGRLYRDGEIVINKGDEGTCLFVIQEGKVEVFDEKEGVEIKIAELGASDRPVSSAIACSSASALMAFCSARPAAPAAVQTKQEVVS